MQPASVRASGDQDGILPRKAGWPATPRRLAPSASMMEMTPPRLNAIAPPDASLRHGITTIDTARHTDISRSVLIALSLPNSSHSLRKLCGSPVSSIPSCELPRSCRPSQTAAFRRAPWSSSHAGHDAQVANQPAIGGNVKCATASPGRFLTWSHLPLPHGITRCYRQFCTCSDSSAYELLRDAPRQRRRSSR